MEAAIRFSQNSLPGEAEQTFLKVDVTGKAFELCRIRKESRQSVSYEAVHASTKVPAFRAFDWHPFEETLVAVGSAGGETTLINIAEGQQDSVGFFARSQRPCNAVALSSQNLLAAGLDKVRTDFCLNIWDFNQRFSTTTITTPTRGFSKSQTDPLHKLAGGEAIVSLKFFNSDTQLLLAGVKDKFVRLYDLREPNGNGGLQFATKCVSNLAVDHLDDNYFASCFPTNEPIVCLWDKRMSIRPSASSHGGYLQASTQPGASLQFNQVTRSPANIWSLRFSKSKRGSLGVLSSAGHFRVYEIGKDFIAEEYDMRDRLGEGETYDQLRIKETYLRKIQDIELPFSHGADLKDQQKRIVSFDFMTSHTKSRQPKIIVLTGEGIVRIASTKPDAEPIAISSTGFMCKGDLFKAFPHIDLSATGISTTLNKIRRAAEPRNILKQAYKSTKQSKAAPKEKSHDLRRMSSFANHCWNTDLGFSEKKVSLEDLTTLLAASRLKCESGYLLDTSKNRSLSADSLWVESFWGWVSRAERISQNKQMLQDNLDMSYVGVYSVWMEEISTSHRQTGASFSSISVVVKNLVNRLNLPQRKGAHSDYPWHRKLCLHVAGLSWGREELDNIVQKLISSNQHTKAAAIAIFADEEKLAYKALRAKSATQSHKMLAMAIAGGAKRRNSAPGTATPSRNGSESETDDDDWAQTIASLSLDLIDPYARAILAYVKSGSWMDVVNEEALPLKQRVGVALRHLSDSELTEFIGRTTRQVISIGNIEGIVLTGTGTREGIDLLQAFAANFNDLQTSILGLSVGGAAARFVGSQQEDKWSARKLEAMREAYRSTMMSWGLKIDRVRFDVASSRALLPALPASGITGPASTVPARTVPKPKQQIRLICTYCTQSLTQFPNDSSTEGNQETRYTAKNPLSPERSAVLGTVCPKCGRHLPRCGVCDLWLGIPDETFAKYWNSTPINSTNSSTTPKSTAAGLVTRSSGTRLTGPSNGSGGSGVFEKGSHPASRSVSATGGSTADNMTASMTASVITTIGPAIASSKVDGGTTTQGSNVPRHATDPRTASAQSLALKEGAEQAISADNVENEDAEEQQQQRIREERTQREKKWVEVMHKFTVFCIRCTHGFHAEHAKLWFEGLGGLEGHRTCPVPGCSCTCNG